MNGLVPARRLLSLAPLLLIALSACTSSTLEQRPGWARGFEEWRRTRPGDPGSLGQLMLAQGEKPQALFLRFSEEDHLFAVGEGRSRRFDAAEARRAAVEDARAQLSTSLWVGIEAESTLEATASSRDGEYSESDRLDETIRSVTGSVLSDLTVADEWTGHHETQEVVYVLVALDRRASIRNLEGLVGQDLAAGRELVKAVDAALAGGSLDALPQRVAELSRRCADLRHNGLALVALGGALDADTDEQVEALQARQAALRHEVLASLSLAGGASEPYVRGRTGATLDLVLRLPGAGGGRPVPGAPLVLDLDGRTQRLRSDADGGLSVPLDLPAETPRGEASAGLRLALCESHDAPIPDCPPCDLGAELAWQVPYQVVHDAQAYDQRRAAADQARVAGDWVAVRDELRAARQLVFDVPDPRRDCDRLLDEVTVELLVAEARDLHERGQWAQAVPAHAAAYHAAQALPGGSPHAATSRQLGLEAALADADDLPDGASDRDLEACLDRLTQAETHWSDPALRSRLVDVRQRLPCSECGRTGRCTRCREGPEPGRIDDDCGACQGKGRVPEDCPHCAGGFLACDDCDKDRGHKTCPQCKGTWSWEHKKCKGAGCKKCDEGLKYCLKCARCKEHKANADDCLTPGKIPVPCPTCKDKGEVRCPQKCERDPRRWNGATYKGYLMVSCQACDGDGARSVECPRGCGDGTCTTCQGSGHRQ